MVGRFGGDDMKYLAIGGFAIDNVINAEGEEQLYRFGGNGAYGTVAASFVIEGFGTDYSYSVTRVMAESSCVKWKR